MKKTTLTILLAIILTACGQRQIEADVPNNPEALATQSLVEKYIVTNTTYDANGLMELYAEELFWMDYGSNDGPISRGNLDYFVHETMSSRDFKIEVKSYTITPDGQFSALNVIFSQPAASSGKWASAPCVVVLEFKNNLIISEIWYYNGTVFH